MKRKPAFAVAFTLLSSTPSPVAAASECPIINGRFYKDYWKDGREFRRFNPVYTKAVDGVNSYRFRSASEAPFYPADGIWRTAEIGGGMVMVTCTASHIRFEFRDVEAKYHAYKSYRPLDGTRIEISNDMSDVSGVFVREE